MKKNYELEIVRVHRNLNKHCWSILQKGLVIDHVDEIILKDTEFRVRPGGQARCIRTGKRNVHAYAKGTVVPPFMEPRGRRKRIRYNPYKHPYFYIEDGGYINIIHECQVVYFDQDGKAWKYQNIR